MKKIIWHVPIAAILFVLLAATGCKKETEFNNNTGDFNSRVLNLPKESLSPDETASLAWMREEEKLARDVYTYFQNRWGQYIFNNIGTAEQTHMDAVLLLLNKYRLPDPVANHGYGEFSIPVLQNLFDQLTAQGYETYVDALKVGATIEELDIRDLNNALKMTDNQDITLVYKNLVRASRNHLRSFFGNIVDAEGTYTPLYLSQAEFDAIVNSPMESGNWW